MASSSAEWNKQRTNHYYVLSMNYISLVAVLLVRALQLVWPARPPCSNAMGYERKRQSRGSNDWFISWIVYLTPFAYWVSLNDKILYSKQLGAVPIVLYS